MNPQQQYWLSHSPALKSCNQIMHVVLVSDELAYILKIISIQIQPPPKNLKSGQTIKPARLTESIFSRLTGWHGKVNISGRATLQKEEETVNRRLWQAWRRTRLPCARPRGHVAVYAFKGALSGGRARWSRGPLWAWHFALSSCPRQLRNDRCPSAHESHMQVDVALRSL